MAKSSREGLRNPFINSVGQMEPTKAVFAFIGFLSEKELFDGRCSVIAGRHGLSVDLLQAQVDRKPKSKYVPEFLAGRSVEELQYQIWGTVRLVSF